MSNPKDSYTKKIVTTEINSPVRLLPESFWDDMRKAGKAMEDAPCNSTMMLGEDNE